MVQMTSEILSYIYLQADDVTQQEPPLHTRVCSQCSDEQHYQQYKKWDGPQKGYTERENKDGRKKCIKTTSYFSNLTLFENFIDCCKKSLNGLHHPPPTGPSIHPITHPPTHPSRTILFSQKRSDCKFNVYICS